MRQRVNIKAILADPEKRQVLLTQAVATVIGVGSDLTISETEARKSAEAACQGS